MIAEPVALVLIALASYRLTAVLTGIDSLLEGTHRRIRGWAYELDDCGEAILDSCSDQVPKPGTPLILSKTVDLVTCPFCLGMWVGTVLLCLWISTWPWDLGRTGWTTALGIAGAQAFLTAVDGR